MKKKQNNEIIFRSCNVSVRDEEIDRSVVTPYTQMKSSVAKLTECLVDSVFVVIEGKIAIADHRAHLREFVVVVPIICKRVQENAKSYVQNFVKT